MARCTAILLNYRRSQNIPHILDALRAQSEPPDILLINNGGFQTFGLKRTVHIPWNAGTWIRYPFAICTDTPYIMYLDDDLIPSDKHVVRDLMAACEIRKDCVVGAFGKRLVGGPRYYSEAPDAVGWVHIVKGRCMMMERGALERVTFGNINRPIKVQHEDIYLSMEVGRGRATNWVEPEMHKRMRNLPEPHAESKKGEHYAERDAMVAWHLEKLYLDDLLHRAEAIPHLCTRGELRFLWQCAMRAPEGLPMVEAGCYKGSSAVMLADAAHQKGSELVLIDRFQYGTNEFGVTCPEEVHGNIVRAYAPIVPRIIESESTVIPDGLDQVGFLHIDTDHRAAHLNKELDEWLALMAPGSILAFHDYCHNSPEMIPAIDERIGNAPEWERIGLERWMIAFRKVANG